MKLAVLPTALAVPPAELTDPAFRLELTLTPPALVWLELERTTPLQVAQAVPEMALPTPVAETNPSPPAPPVKLAVTVTGLMLFWATVMAVAAPVLVTIAALATP
jgi:hypothetical protein